MKVTVTIPDEIYRSVKVKSALLGRTVRDVTVDLFRRWIAEEVSAVGEAPPADWVEEWLKHRIPESQPGPTVREIMEESRGRLDTTDATGPQKSPGRSSDVGENKVRRETLRPRDIEGLRKDAIETPEAC